ncbi:Arc family DNA-binding protein [Enterobacter chengduensis]|uniref:Arc family DNA-binding protein n=1 Tax=Enterobacter chengduensis TaxID=2494701 RepID=UPI00200546C0|nr:Arc family DNA-binding protein [Enterobacter chengduensis]MCK7171577.1 Arc family DNA-binding protein [Enterobacter chengduensis]MCM8033601.1 Arc family DNA-binding protein [Enterobacter chengduensis]
MSEKFPSQTQDKFTVRFPDGLRDAVAERARRNGRSMNSEIIQIIEDAIAAEASGFPAGDARELRSVIRMKDDSIENYKTMVCQMAELVKKVTSLAQEEIEGRDKGHQKSTSDTGKKPTK